MKNCIDSRSGTETRLGRFSYLMYWRRHEWMILVEKESAGTDQKTPEKYPNWEVEHTVICGQRLPSYDARCRITSVIQSMLVLLHHPYEPRYFYISTGHQRCFPQPIYSSIERPARWTKWSLRKLPISLRKNELISVMLRIKNHRSELFQRNTIF